ncbi:Transcription factor RF2a [Glycine soja]|nr:Transcription factor RF2a [Glycine soja]
MEMALDVKPKAETLEEESSYKDEEAAPQPSAIATCTETVVDPKRVKRQSAQRSRVRKLQYISELERSVTTLQTEVSALSPRVAFLDHQRLILNVDNSALKQRIAALAQDKIFKDEPTKDEQQSSTNHTNITATTTTNATSSSSAADSSVSTIGMQGQQGAAPQLRGKRQGIVL